MTITYWGHSCFRVEQDGYVLVLVAVGRVHVALVAHERERRGRQRLDVRPLVVGRVLTCQVQVP